jgi:hypothetical protein
LRPGLPHASCARVVSTHLSQIPPPQPFDLSFAASFVESLLRLSLLQERARVHLPFPPRAAVRSLLRSHLQTRRPGPVRASARFSRAPRACFSTAPLFSRFRVLPRARRRVPALQQRRSSVPSGLFVLRRAAALVFLSRWRPRLGSGVALGFAAPAASPWRSRVPGSRRPISAPSRARSFPPRFSCP